jgi:hypothetical protein
MNIDLNAARPAVDDCVHCLADTKLKIEDLIHFLDCNRFNKNNNFILKLLK